MASNWHICLLSLALALAAITTTTSAFSSRSKRALAKRGGSSFASTRRVFCFTLAGGAHTMFSGIRTHSSSSHNSRKRPQSSSSTTLKYRAVDDNWDYCDVTDLSDESSSSSSSKTDSLWEAALRPTQEVRQVSIPRDEKSTKHHSSNDGLIETAKAFIPVAMEIGVVAVAAANFHLN
mmetsp:Transcript_24855/g.53622  ORF Transcript_24855/g.53622 Transcript_24855/m.53622 type:complete len:178 (+) Transcript_24855:64-597(+)